MIWAVAFPYLYHPLWMRDQLTSRASRQIAKYERIVSGGRFLPELSKQDIFQATDPGLIYRTRVMGDQAHKPIISAQLTEEPRAVDRMEAGIDQIWGIADVMKPRSRHESVSSHTRNHCQPRCLSSYGLNMLPPAGQCFR
jgi:hypothetical protein